jgi:hypothetical protein
MKGYEGQVGKARREREGGKREAGIRRLERENRKGCSIKCKTEITFL